MSDVYSQRSYGEIEVGFGEKIGILVVDFQLGFTDARFRMGGSALVERALENTMRLLEAARACNAPVVDAFQFGFRALLVEDCCGDQEEGPHKDTLRDVGRRYADIVSSEEVIRQLKLNGGRH